MALLTNAPRGTADVLPAKSYQWQYVEKITAQTAQNFGFKEIRVPTFEHTELFTRSVGDTTDVVQKEMYTFNDKGNRSITLRPEGTAGSARAILQNGLLGGALPLKVFYQLSCFRYEKPQAGRLREFHQFGVEMFGSESPAADAEVILLANEILHTLGIRDIRLNLNSIGCPTCRAKYHEALKAYFSAHKDGLCETCLGRLEKNPMRLLDCKSKECQVIAKDAPIILDYLCEDCFNHFEGLKTRLTECGLQFEINPRIVRGLDYYTRTVFEFITDTIGAQGTVCGGGRYDGLVKELGGPQTPGLGFGMGLERLIMTMEACSCDFELPKTCDIYIANIGESAAIKAFTLTRALRHDGFYAECDTVGRSLKAQMKYADKIGAAYSLVLGDDEVSSNQAKLKNMQTGEVTEITLDTLSESLSTLQAQSALSDLSDTVENWSNR